MRNLQLDESKRSAARLSLTHYGRAAQMDKAKEECAELITALCHLTCRGEAAMLEVIEEAADVEIMLECIRMLAGDEAMDAAVSKKLQRLDGRMRSEQEEGRR